MSAFSEKNPFTLPDELAQSYEVRSCLKYTEQSATYLLCGRETSRLYLLKTASDPVFAGLLSNEKSILEYIHSSVESPVADIFPVPVYLAVHPFPAGTESGTANNRDVVTADTQGTFSTGETYYIRTYIEGRTLEELCETNYKKPGLPLARALDYVISLTELLHFLHTLTPPLIHRDIKPQNVVIDPEGGCHFIDFGISRFYQTAKRSDTFIMGTKLTAPPEQFGYQQTDTRSDLYSLGILLLYCITGEYEVNEHNLAELEPPLQNIVRKATMFDPNKRYQTAGELLPELLAVRYPAVQQPNLRRDKLLIRRILSVISVVLNIALLIALLIVCSRKGASASAAGAASGRRSNWTVEMTGGENCPPDTENTVPARIVCQPGPEMLYRYS